MGAAPLPGRVGQAVTHSGVDAQVGVTGDQVHLIQAPGFQITEEPGPRRGRFRGGDLHTKQLPVPVGINPGGQQHAGFHDAPTFTHFSLVSASQET
ncbi:hypothetical protein CAURIS_09365 [Corynebacterium auris]|nr:hypothetical protein CAURIS_09365 [Corynebacterium auris]